jgi:hypothetical protein
MISGFKSVFAVANTVSIYSNGFNFALDKRRQLGLLNPTIINELHPKAKSGWTLFVLGLEVDNDEYRAVKTCLEEIQSEMLLFTRRLRKIEITFREAGRRTNTENVVKTMAYDVHIDEDCSQMYTITSTATQSHTEVRYFRQELEIPNMPNTPSRLGVTESKMVVAFPFDTDNHPILREQKIFAFMPLHQTTFHVHPATVTLSDVGVFDTGRFPDANKSRRHP